MWTPDRPPTATEARLGFTVGWGWFVFPRFGDAARPWAGHNGSIVGFSSTILHFLAAQLTVVLLLNRDGFDRPDHLAAPLAAALLAATAEPPGPLPGAGRRSEGPGENVGPPRPPPLSPGRAGERLGPLRSPPLVPGRGPGG